MHGDNLKLASGVSPGDGNLRIIQGDCLAGLAEVAAESVQCCVTSPPYWGLRSYLPKGHPLKHLEIDSEKSPQEYVAKLVAVFAEVWRVLKPDGTLWVNLGDSYAGGGNGGGGSFANAGPRMLRMPGTNKNVPGRKGDRGCVSGLKPKDLCMIPARVALALQAAGWYLRSEIIWHKPNAMPPALILPCIRAGSRPGDTVLDPFGGSGTTAQVAIEEGRKAIIFELNADYIPLIEQRTNKTPGLHL